MSIRLYYAVLNEQNLVMKVETQKAVTLAYTLTDTDGNILDKADANEPFIYLHGTGGVIPGLEKALDGKSIDEQLTVSLKASEAYGDYSDKLTSDVPKDMFAELDDKDMFVGAQFHAETDQGMQVVTVKAINDETITIDGNHPMAGKDLNFDVTVLAVRDATEDELSHGHIHAEGAHDHGEGDSCCSG